MIEDFILFHLICCEADSSKRKTATDDHIRGGLAGILTAHFLEQSGRQCVVLEADRIGSGQTGHTTAKVTSQHGLIYQKLMKCAGKKQAEQYAKINQEALRRY